MKVADLKRELKARGLTTSGNKTDLIARLQVGKFKQMRRILFIYINVLSLPPRSCSRR